MITEYDIHLSVLSYLRTVLPTALIFHVPNSPRSKVAGYRLKRLGMRAGVPDLAVITDGRLYFFEVKKPGSYATPEQRSFIEQAEEHGVRCAIVRSIGDVQRSLDAWNVKTRAA